MANEWYWIWWQSGKNNRLRAAYPMFKVMHLSGSKIYSLLSRRNYFPYLDVTESR